jgi:hypothetical protein
MMKRRDFLRATALAGSGIAIAGVSNGQAVEPIFGARARRETWFDRPMRWAQLTLVENDPGNYDPDFWLDYFRRIHADGACLSAGGIVAYYPTDIPLHHRSEWMAEGDDPLGYLMDGCRRMNMSVILRTDPHAVRQNVYDAHPDWIAVTADGEKRQHWADPDLWVTCGLGPYNFEFMTLVNDEIMQRYQPDGIFSNRWAGSGMCYCEHCARMFREFSGGMELPRGADQQNPVNRMHSRWGVERLKELWFLWDEQIRRRNPEARFIPNGFPDRVLTGQLSDIFFTDHQGRSGYTTPWSNARTAKQLRATLGMKPLGGIFSVGFEEANRWKDSVQSDAELRIWVAQGTANGMRPWFTKFGGVLFDRRWLDSVERIYQFHYRSEKYLRNTSSLAQVGLVYAEQTGQVYGGEAWQQNSNGHDLGMYHALIEARVPFDMVNTRLLDPEHIGRFKLLILPNTAVLSDAQCAQLRRYVESGGSILATFETSLYDEEGNKRSDFGLADLFGVSFRHDVEGRMQNSYLRLRSDPETGAFHPILAGLEDAYRTIHGDYRLVVEPNVAFPSPVTLIESYPDLPMEHMYQRVPESNIREVYLRDLGRSRITYIPWDVDRTFWRILNFDHSRLLSNMTRWTLGEDVVAQVDGPGIVDVVAWRQENSMTVHLVNLTNPMMLKGPFREILPLDSQQVSVAIPSGATVTGVRLLASEQTPAYEVTQGRLRLAVPRILDHEIVAIDLR